MKKNRKPKRRRGSGTTLLLAMLLAGSAGVRVASSAGEVLPLIPERTKTSLPAPEIMTASSKLPDRKSMRTLLEALKMREAALEKKEAGMAVREKSLAVTRTEIERRLVALEETEARLRATLAYANSAAEDDIARLVLVYENMKAKEAAAVFETMEPEFAAGFLARMKPESAAAIMAGLSPQVAYTLSVVVAGRNAGAPRD